MEVSVEVHYCTPPDTVLGDVLRLLRSRTWAAFMTRHVGPRLEKVSPTDAAALEALDQQWQAASLADDRKRVDCVICMDTDGEDADHVGSCRHRQTRSGAQLACGHRFHRRCIRSWLELQSTCPICRWQFPKEFAGRFVVRRLQSTAVLPARVRPWPRAQIAQAPVGGHSVRVVVNLTLEKARTATAGRLQCPCELTALLLDEASGEMFSEMDTRAGPRRLDRGDAHRIASTRFATAKFSDGVAAASGRKRRCFRRQQRAETSKRPRLGEL